MFADEVACGSGIVTPVLSLVYSNRQPIPTPGAGSND